MILWMILFLGAAGLVGYFQAEKAKEKRKVTEERIGKELEVKFEFGTFDLSMNESQLSIIKSGLNVRDEVSFRLVNDPSDIAVLKGDSQIGKIPNEYHKYRLFLEALQAGKSIIGNCIKKQVQGGVDDSVVTISFQVMD